jgi:phage terminase small subunit
MDKKRVKTQVKAIMESKTLQDAYLKTHNCTEETANKNAYKMLKNPEIVAELEKQLAEMKTIDINKQTLIKLYQSILIGWQAQDPRVKASDVIRVFENLQKLVPEFVDRHSITEYEKMTGDQLDKELSEKLRSFGVNS